MVCLGQECLELDMTIADDELVNDVLQVVYKIRPQWPAEKIRHSVFFFIVASSDLQQLMFQILQMFKDGITNKLIGVYLENLEESTILVRIYGENTEKIIDREAEIKNIKVCTVL